MHRVRTRRIIITVMLVLAFLVSGISVYAASSGVTLKNNNAPENLITGQSFTIKGTITATQKMKRVEVGIANSFGKWTSYKYDNKKVKSKTFNLKKADRKLKFGKLKEGTYYYRIYAHTKDGKVHTLLNKKFTVSTPKPALSELTYPKELRKGQAFSLKGKISSNVVIKNLEIGVVNKFDGAWTEEKYTCKPEAKSFNISAADNSIHFGDLEGGDYYYRIVAKTSYGTFTLCNYAFTVKDSSLQVGQTGDPSDIEVQLTGCNSPGQYNVGKEFKVKGTITANMDINRVEAGIVTAATNKWTRYKYDSQISGKTFNLSKAASALKFNKLPGGTYYYRIYIHTLSGVKVVANKKFKVIPSNKPQAAVNWAIKIANDDSFTYGKKPETNKVGCYFCGTNKWKKPAGFEKTYVCMTFVHAAYAHGAGDPELLAQCKKGKGVLLLTDYNVNHYSCWEKVGLCSELKVDDLMPGDVIVMYAEDNSSGHLAMYAGNGAIVDATSSAGDVWGPNSIALRNNKASTYLKRGVAKDARSYVMRYNK